MKPFDTDKMPWLFTPHGDGELNEYFSTDHSKIIAETSKEVLASLSESRDRLSGKLCYEFHYNQRRYKYTLLRFADMIGVHFRNHDVFFLSHSRDNLGNRRKLCLYSVPFSKMTDKTFVIFVRDNA